jgi:glycosyltransferase involved in cell wall biosynthesis
MRIAEVAPIFLPIPPPKYGGTERVVHALTEELVRRGHEVTLFAASGSTSSAHLVTSSPRPLWDSDLEDPLAYRLAQVEDVVRRSGEFDVVHSHLELLPFTAVPRMNAAVVSTLHGRLDLPELFHFFERFPDHLLVSISDAQRQPLQRHHLHWLATIHHGLPLGDTYTLGSGTGGYLAFLGRIAPEKDPVAAIRIAIEAGIPLKVAARVDSADEHYFRHLVKPLLEHPLVEWVGEVDDVGKNQLLGEAMALLLPITWDEPFGLAFIESLATGTPVITRPLGSLPEMIKDGLHGFLVNTEPDFVDACRRVGCLDRRACREWALDHFSVSRMTDAYEAVFAEAIGLRRAS